MNKHITHLALSLSFVLSSTLTSEWIYAEEFRVKSLDRMTYTINPDVEVKGPIYKDASSREEKNQYGTEMVKMVLKEAHRKAKKYLETNETQAYYSFLILALTVPLHEGLYIQYRKVKADVCNTDANNGELIKKAGPESYNYFTQYLMGGDRPFIVPCDQIQPDSALTQIIRGFDGTDLSVMQVSVRWHFDDFLANRKYESTASTLDYGLGILMDGFDPVYRNITDYKCLYTGKWYERKKVINYKNLIRGIWAGRYNSGSIAKTCRFKDINSEYKSHDEGFLKNLDKVLGFDGVIGMGGELNFQINSDVSETVKEVIANFTNNTNHQVHLKQLLAK